MKEDRKPQLSPTRLLCCLTVLTFCGCGEKSETSKALPEAPSVTQSDAVQNPLPFEKKVIDLAWYFASSIDDDPDDRADYQGKVASARFHRDGDIKTALSLAHSIYRWNRGLVLGEIAEGLARNGRREEAERVIQDALEIAAKGVEQGWQAERIRLALGGAQAILNAQEDSAEDPSFKKQVRDGGRMRLAPGVLKRSHESPASVIAFIETSTATHPFASRAYELKEYALIARQTASGNSALAIDALDRLWACATNEIALMAVAVQMDVVETALSCGLVDYARGKSDVLIEALLNRQDPAIALLPAKTRLAKLLVKVEHQTLAAELANSVASQVDTVLDMEQPAILADAASALYLAAPSAVAETHFLEAINRAGKLKNRRPRCKALCDIALSLYDCGMNNARVLSALENEAHKLH